MKPYESNHVKDYKIAFHIELTIKARKRNLDFETGFNIMKTIEPFTIINCGTALLWGKLIYFSKVLL